MTSSSLSRSWKHDVFPSFHGPDVRKHFLSHILKEFRSKGIDLFIDNEIKRGESIGPELKKAIQESKIAIVLLSKKYASSSWCLDELVEIMSKAEGQTVLTIFYEVEPTDVKKQTGDFGKVFKKTCRGKTKEKIQTWRNALEVVATIAGYHSRNWDDEAAMIEKIAADISKLLNHLAPSPDMDRLIGMEAHMGKMQLLLRLDLEDEVRMIGIWGPPGIGKSTIARFLFNQLSNGFQLSAIMENIRERYPRPCLDEGSAQLQLQNQMLSLIINHKDIMITHLGVAQERLKDRKVLLILDDVDRSAQLDALARDIRWFGPGSRIIITTEDQKILNAHGMIDHIYKVNFPSNAEALQMFSMYAFGQKSPKDGFTDLSNNITNLVGNLPLGLKVMGSYFRGMSKQDWTRALPKLWTRLDGEIESVLKFSYDALCDEDKDLFLHIACFFNNETVQRVEKHLAKKFLDVRQRLHILDEKSLISIEWGRIKMHSLLVKLGQEIVRKQSLRKPGKRQFLVDHRDICEVFNDPTTITGNVIGIHSSNILNWDNLNIIERAFEKLSNLQFLRLTDHFDSSNMASAAGSLKYISPKLQYLHWSDSPMTSLPIIANLEFLVNLIMHASRLEKLWEGTKLLRNLKSMDLQFSRYLKELPNLSTATKLEQLYLNFCSSLVKLPSIGNAINLQTLSLKYCSCLVEFHSSIGNATNLQELDLSYCSSLVELPSYMGNLHRLTELNLEGCSKLEVLPTNINLESLIELNLNYSSSLKRFPEISTNITDLRLRGTAIEEVPSSIRSWPRLKILEMSYYENLKEYPHAFDCITELHLRNTEIQEIGSWVKGCSRLMRLSVRRCRKLVSLPQLPDSIIELHVEHCDLLERLDCSFLKSTMYSLKFVNCFKLNQEARDLIIQTPTRGFSLLPGGEVPPCFTYRAPGSSLAVNLNEKPLITSTKFKVCIVLGSKSRVHNREYFSVECIIKSTQRAFTSSRPAVFFENNQSDLLYIFDYEAEEMTSYTELDFVFKLKDSNGTWMIKECGILQLLEVHAEKILNLQTKRCAGTSRSSKRRRVG